MRPNRPTVCVLHIVMNSQPSTLTAFRSTNCGHDKGLLSLNRCTINHPAGDMSPLGAAVGGMLRNCCDRRYAVVSAYPLPHQLWADRQNASISPGAHAAGVRCSSPLQKNQGVAMISSPTLMNGREGQATRAGVPPKVNVRLFLVQKDRPEFAVLGRRCGPGRGRWRSGPGLSPGGRRLGQGRRRRSSRAPGRA